MIALSALLIGWRTPIASLMVGVLILALNCWVYALGKINHDILVAIAPFFLAFSGWGRRYSIDSRGTEPPKKGCFGPGWPVALFALSIGYAMFTAGWVKLTTDWLDLDTQATLGHLTTNYHVFGRETVLAKSLLAIENKWFWEQGDWAPVLFELGFLLAVIRRRFFLALCAVACLFHLGVALMFDIGFWGNVLAYGAVVSWNSFPVPKSVKNWFHSIGGILSTWNPVALVVLASIPPCFAIFFHDSVSDLIRFPMGMLILCSGVLFSLGWVFIAVLGFTNRQSGASGTPAAPPSA